MAADDGTKAKAEKKERRSGGKGGRGPREESAEGKKGDDNKGRREGKGEGGKGGRPRKPREELPTVEDPQGELDKLMAKDAPVKPNRDALDVKIASTQAEIDGHKRRTEQITKDLDAIKEKNERLKKQGGAGMESCREKLRDLKKQIVGVIEERKRISGSIDKIREKKNEMDDAIKKQQAFVGKFNSNERIDEEIKRIEEHMAHNSLSVKEEKNFIADIKALNKKRDEVKQLEIMEGKRGAGGKASMSLPELFEARKGVDERLTTLRAEEKVHVDKLNDLREKSQSKDSDRFQKLLDERKELREKISELIGSIREKRDEHSKLDDAWYNHDRLVKNLKWQLRQKNIKEREARQKEWEEKKAAGEEPEEGDEEEQKEKMIDWDLATRICECEQLMVFLQQYLPEKKEKKEAAAPSTAAVEGAYTKDAKLADDPLGLNAFMVDEVVSKRSKKKDKKKAHTAAKSNLQVALKEEGTVEIKLALGMIQQFTSMALPIPNNSDDAEATISLLKEKKAYYEEQGALGLTLKEVIKKEKGKNKKPAGKKEEEASKEEKGKKAEAKKEDPLDKAFEAAGDDDEDEEESKGAAPSNEVLKAEALKHFEAADANGDGVLTKSEIKKYMSKVEPSLKAHFGVASGGWKELWDHMDHDCDGSMTVNEWEAMYIQKMGDKSKAAPVVKATKGGFAAPTGGPKGRGAKAGQLTEAEKKARGLLYDTSKARAVREESSDDEDEDAADFEGGDPFDGL